MVLHRTPELSIDGALLRAWVEQDAPRLVQAWGDPDIAAWNPVPADLSLGAATKWIGGVQDRAERMLALDWVIDVGAGPRGVGPGGASGVVGEVGLTGFSEKHRGALIGYWLLPDARGRGLASASVRAITTWAHATLDLSVIVARCHSSNTASQRVAERAGFEPGATDAHDYQLWRSFIAADPA